MHALLFSLLLAASPSAPKAALLPFTPGEGVNEKVAATLTDVAAGEIRRASGMQLITQQEIAAVIGFDREKTMLTGCHEDSCLAEIGGALGVDRLVAGSVAKLGQSWLVSLKLLDARRGKVLAQADRRLRKGTLDDVLDALPEMTKELFQGQPAAAALAVTSVAAGQSPAAPVPAVVTAPAPAPAPAQAAAPAPAPAVPAKPFDPGPGWAEQPLQLEPAQSAALELATDGKGRYIAYVPYGGGNDLMLAGDAKALFQQRIGGASADGQGSFDYTFWEPRAKARWQAAFGRKDGKLELYCGETPQALTAVPSVEAKKILAGARLFKPRWQRMGYAIARDDLGTYYFVDRAREPDDSTDFRLYVGTKGKARAVELTDVISDNGGLVLITADWTLKFQFRSEDSGEVELVKNGQRQPLVFLSLYERARFAYTELGAYAGQSLGTPCDGAY